MNGIRIAQMRFWWDNQNVTLGYWIVWDHHTTTQDRDATSNSARRRSSWYCMTGHHDMITTNGLGMIAIVLLQFDSRDDIPLLLDFDSPWCSIQQIGGTVYGGGSTKDLWEFPTSVERCQKCRDAKLSQSPQVRAQSSHPFPQRHGRRGRFQCQGMTHQLQQGSMEFVNIAQVSFKVLLFLHAFLQFLELISGHRLVLRPC
mmetsp:Transcript_17122/g.39596  ORF Transcript_17122/g.39596 Transcript_17122/m.39596 type:complete len:201 (-) Transcript_17122:944-1546(-)